MITSKQTLTKSLLFLGAVLGVIMTYKQRFQSKPTPVATKKEFTGYKAVIYDLNGVLVEINKMGLASEIGLKDMMCYYLLDCKDKQQVQRRLFETLAAIDGYEKGPHAPCGECGDIMPALMCRWMDGSMKDPQHELIRINKKINALKDAGFFKNNREYRVIKKTINAMFHPHTLNKHRKPIKRMLSLAKEINEKGRCTQCVLSNWDKPSFEDFLTTKTGKALTRVIDEKNIVISADIQYNKPHPDAFGHVLKCHNLDACECIFLDDQQENVEAARALGMVAYQVTPKNHKEIKRKLTALNLL